MNKEKITIDNGGTAFPIPYGQVMCDEGKGMTLRDWFAGQALAGSVGYVNEFGPAYAASLKHTAQAAYRIADAMLEARKEMA